ncbi:MAG: efflux RND transporter periplasmic adaptor subunit [Bdellovibrio bacteriovorus]
MLVSATALLALTACGDKPETAVAVGSAPPPSVIAVPARVEAIEDESTFVGRVAAVDKVELRARVPGFLKRRDFTEGQDVKAGDLLFEIEPDQYQAVVQQREADLAKAKADQQNTTAQLLRGQELLKDKNIAQAKVDELQAADSIAKASIEQAEAALNSAKLDLGYTRVLAPVAGRIGLAKYSVGNLVGPESGPLATLISHDPIYIQFPLTQRELLNAKRDVQAGGGDPRNVVIRVRLPDGTLYDKSGTLNFVDVTTDPGTDTVTLRAELPNPDRFLVDGQYVGVLVQSGEPASAIVIPQSALQVDQQGTFVLIIDAEGKAQVRRVQTAPAKGSLVAVKSGLMEGELVIAEGIQKVRPGQVVTATPPQEVKAPAASEGQAGGDGR